MHSGEEFFIWGWPQYSLIAALIVSYLMLSFANKLPSMKAFKDFADTIDSAGGNIILLTLLTVWSIKIAMQFFYHLLGLPADQFDKANSIITAGITYVQGGLSGMFIGALIKTLTGGKANGGGGPPTQVPDTLTANFVPSGQVKP
jgi:hypothetical protein